MILTKESLNYIMDIIDAAIGLDARPPYEAIISTEFAEKAMEY